MLRAHLQFALDGAISNGSTGGEVLEGVASAVAAAGCGVHNDLAQPLQGLDVSPLCIHLPPYSTRRSEAFRKLEAVGKLNGSHTGSRLQVNTHYSLRLG